MPVPAAITDLSTTPALNSPAGSESPSTLDDYIRTHAAFIKQVNDASVKTTGDQTIAGTKTFSSAPVVPGLNGGQLAGMRNKIINGNFGINQRGVSGTVTLAAGAYGHDRFKAGASGCTYTFVTVQNVTTLTITAGSLMQVIEGNNLQSGTHVLSWTGTAQGRVDSGSYGASGAVTGTAVGGTNQTIEFNTGTLSKVQYEPGTVATPFEHRPYGAEFALCQRYLPAFNSTGGTSHLGVGMLASTTVMTLELKHPVPTRVPPTGVSVSAASHITVYTTGMNTVAASIGSINTSNTLSSTIAINASGWTGGQGAYAYFNNSSGQLLLEGCEL